MVKSLKISLNIEDYMNELLNTVETLTMGDLTFYNESDVY
jgi:hypothetical protein